MDGFPNATTLLFFSFEKKKSVLYLRLQRHDVYKHQKIRRSATSVFIPNLLAHNIIQQFAIKKEFVVGAKDK